MKIILGAMWMTLTTFGPYYIAKHMGYMNAFTIGFFGFLIGGLLLMLVTGVGGGSGSSSDLDSFDFSFDSDD